jgi:hypothetical protein
MGTLLELQNWYKGYFKWKTFEIQKVQKEAFWELPIPD